MQSTTLARIEEDVQCLSLTEQLTLLERLAAQIRYRADDGAEERRRQLAAMAQDPEVQRELRAIRAIEAG